ncbi:hypothetical protein N9O95_04110 [Alphaproteobacteria bacterium]|nr:hypothetical protein [Alphaproteobacteria bacterium]
MIKEGFHETSTYYAIKRESVVSEFLDNELTVIDLERGHYFLGRGSCIGIFLLLDEPYSYNELLNICIQKFEVEEQVLNKELDDLFRFWLEHELIVATDRSSTPVYSENTRPNSWEKPVFIAFDDMKDLLLLDPIPESQLDDQGWPLAD